MKLRSFLTVLAAIAGTAFLIGTLGFGHILAQSPVSLLQGSPIESPTAAMFVPRDAAMVASLLVNPDRLETARQLWANPGDRAAARSEFDQFKQGILGSTDLNYDRDIKPWIGDEITAAVTTLDVDRDSENGEERGYLLSLLTKDPQRSREFLQLFWQRRASAGTQLGFEQYKGSRIIYGKVSGKETERSLASAVVGNRYVLFANTPKVLKNAINNVQTAEFNLVSSPDYQRAIASLKNGKIGMVYLNLPQFSKLTQAKSTAQDGSLAISIGLNPQGLVAETALLGDAKAQAEAPTLTKPVAALNYIPAASPISASGTHLDRLGKGLTTRDDRLTKLIQHPIASLEKQWNIKLDQDIFRWVTGEYAIALVPKSSKDQSENTDWIFVAEKKDAAADAAIARLDQIAKDQGISTGTIQLKNQPVTVWTRLAAKKDTALEAEVAGVRATIGQYVIFATSIDTMNAALNAEKNGLANSKPFDRAIAPLQTPNTGYLYLDWDKAEPILDRQLPALKVLELAGQPLFEHLKSIGVSNYGNDAGIQRGGAFVQLN